MKFSRLRLSGFKSFVEPAELHIEAGLTGVVGPNGCGKSNLLEALRWVMGESSYKSMRASGMDDVIFSGTSQRPARNMAEVMLTVDNDSRTAPAQFNGEETLEISRRIEREAGSAYRINGKDVRARDVQLFFADASSGSRSPALVRQGQIAEIINAKPQARRLILEEAAGITGLHTRRHEAELKLKAAEQNMTRLDDVVAQLESQLNSLKRQARQAQKYKLISAEIRKLEAAGLYVTWRDATAAATRDSAALDEATRVLAEHTRAASEKLRLRDEAGETLPALREQETIRAAVLQRLTMERQSLDAEEKRAEDRRKELEARLAQITGDTARVHDSVKDTAAVLERLTTEQTALQAAESGDQDARAAAAKALQAAADSWAKAQEAADQASAKLSELTARRNGLRREAEDLAQRIARFETESTTLAGRKLAMLAQAGGEAETARLAAAIDNTVNEAAAAEAAIATAEEDARTARRKESESRTGHDEARRAAERLQTEVRTLGNLLKSDSGGLWPPMVDALRVKPGYEAALAAALGDDIDAAADEAAPIHWRGLPPLVDTAPLPDGAEPLSRFVESPPALHRRLSHIGVIAPSLGPALQPALRPGQRLVSKDGGVWRWDGFTSAADAQSAAARRLAERNRLGALEVEARSAAHEADAARLTFDASRQEAEAAIQAERARREAWRAAASAVEFARRAQQVHERQMAERVAQASALEEAARRVGEQLADARRANEKSRADTASLPAPDGLSAELETLRDHVNRERAVYAETRASHDGLEREAQTRINRLGAIANELTQWREREAKAAGQIEQLAGRQEETRAALSDIADIPQHFADKRLKLMNTLQEAESERRHAADALAGAENNLRGEDQLLRAAQETLATSREEHARLEARLENSSARREQCGRRIVETLECQPEDTVRTAGLEEDKLPAADDIERKLLSLREDRERLGGVNLSADDEAVAVAAQLEGLVKERDDLIQAINKLRGAIGSLNKEGRQRLLDAFGTVNEKFAELFTRLFGGGNAELQLIESDDPLEAGLEILANPPGKKPTVLSLLSGGEQTLTALSLIFAVFLTNPSPICVLDEVDAPLDDHNVERFCNLLDAMLEKTETRFLIITHHPLTMARMHRLFGVTMMERGVSQLVSVNLEQAEELAEAV